MSRKLFGTDGIRGTAGKDLTSELAHNVGRAAAAALSSHGKRPLVLIATDTRISKDMLSGAVSSGLMCSGADAVMLGVMPTPAVAYLTKKLKADAGIMISASHNSFEDNGIKIFNADGYKLSDELEEEIEKMIFDHSFTEPHVGDGVGRCFVKDYTDLYIDHLSQIADLTASRLKIAVDCANGSASRTAKQLFSALGLCADIFCSSPNGTNINNGCGSTHVEHISKIVKDGDYDLGLAFDGDADRLIAVDENGDEVDGDKIIAICAARMIADGKLKNGAVVGTVMSNLGLSRFCEERGLEFIRERVGDRYVLERMLTSGANIGGEQSGHIIFSDHATTGDGQLAAIKLIDAVIRADAPLSELSRIMTKYPQITINVKASKEEKSRIMSSDTILSLLDRLQGSDEYDGRIILRPSGTEPLIRVMAEGSDESVIRSAAGILAEAIEKEKTNRIE